MNQIQNQLFDSEGEMTNVVNVNLFSFAGNQT
jgi:hypothetical protein